MGLPASLLRWGRSLMSHRSQNCAQKLRCASLIRHIPSLVYNFRLASSWDKRASPPQAHSAAATTCSSPSLLQRSFERLVHRLGGSGSTLIGDWHLVSQKVAVLRPTYCSDGAMSRANTITCTHCRRLSEHCARLCGRPALSPICYRLSSATLGSLATQVETMRRLRNVVRRSFSSDIEVRMPHNDYRNITVHGGFLDGEISRQDPIPPMSYIQTLAHEPYRTRDERRILAIF